VILEGDVYRTRSKINQPQFNVRRRPLSGIPVCGVVTCRDCALNIVSFCVMSRIAFADESGTDGRSKCYTIGVVSFEASCLRSFEEYFTSLHNSHGVQGEAKWTRIRGSHGLINFSLDVMNSILRSHTASFDAIVVNTALFRNWRLFESKESAFYQTYTYLLRHIVRRARETAEVYIDDRSDAYAKRHEMVEKIGNYMLARLESRGRLTNVQKVSSRDHVGIQVADLLTGAINAAHARHLDPQFVMHPAKHLAIERLSRLLGWDDLCYDTMPSKKFNIWHFPPEFRATPRTQKNIQLATDVPYITSADLLAARNPVQPTAITARRSA